MAARVSVIVPVYNVAGHVADCLTSIAAQSFRDFEVIVVNDGATDGSDAIARATVAGDERFAVLDQPNGGLSAARNAGLDRARGELIAFVDSDDRIAPDYLERLVTALDQSGADWVSCAIEFHPEGGKPWAHSGLHGDWDIPEGAAPERDDLSDWTQVVRHFPSAWNKLYRRELIGETRFDEGLNYEDHAFFWRYAARTDHILRLPDPLYLSTQERAGQITRDGSDRVFEQFAVLDILETVSAENAKPGRDTALARIATRLSFERAEAVTDRRRRARFLEQSRDWLARRGFAPDDTLGVPAFWIEALQGHVPLSVIVPSNGDPEALAETLDSLAAQSLREAEILVVPDEDICPAGSEPRKAIYDAAARGPGVSVLAGGAGVHGARNRGLAAARGRAVVFLDAGDVLMPRALVAWHNRMRKAGAGLGLARMRMGGAADLHPGLHDRAGIAPGRLEDPEGFAPGPEDMLVIHGHPSAKIFDADLLRRHAIAFPPGALSSTHMVLRAMAAAGRVVWIAPFPVRIAIRPDTRSQWRAPVSAAALRASLAGMEQDAGLALAEGWQARLWARVVWEKVNFADFPTAAAAGAFEQAVRDLSPGVPGLGENPTLDPFIGPRIRDLLGLPTG